MLPMLVLDYESHRPMWANWSNECAGEARTGIKKTRHDALNPGDRFYLPSQDGQVPRVERNAEAASADNPVGLIRRANPGKVKYSTLKLAEPPRSMLSGPAGSGCF